MKETVVRGTVAPVTYGISDPTGERLRRVGPVPLRPCRARPDGQNS